MIPGAPPLTPGQRDAAAVTSDYRPLPGDYFLAQIGGALGLAVRCAQSLTGDASRYTHAGIVLDDATVLEAMPGGARIAPLDVVLARRPLAVSANPMPEHVRAAVVAAARTYVGVPYSFADYLALAGALAARRLPLLRPLVGWLRRYVEDSGHLICSALVDRASRGLRRGQRLDDAAAGVELFDDGRWPGDVTPGDLAHVGVLVHLDAPVQVHP